MLKLRDYQIKISAQAAEVLDHKKIVYLAMEVRTGKTLTALNTAKLFGAKKVLFLTKKKAISSIQWDYDNFGFTFDLTVINDESLHLVTDIYDLIIHDEHHRFGAFPKPNKVAQLFKKRYSKLPMIFLSGTPTPESHSQWFNQFWVSNHSPFKQYTNFYKWAVDYVDVKEKRLGYAVIKDYSQAKEQLIRRATQHYIITFTQAQAGFTTSVNEMILECEMQPITNLIINKLKKNLVVKNTDGQVILGDTGVKLQQKHLQIASGTCKFEDGSSKIIDNSKALFIKEKFSDHKIAIFYKFKEELNMLKEVFKDKLTTDLEDFNNSDKWIALQFLSGREGVSLKMADYIVAINIDFSATTYFQFRDRMTTMDRKENTLFWVFSKDTKDLKSIERVVYQSVLNKKDFTISIYKKTFENNLHILK
jgi:superfamily II DNA or RNA helicase